MDKLFLAMQDIKAFSRWDAMKGFLGREYDLGRVINLWKWMKYLGNSQVACIYVDGGIGDLRKCLVGNEVTEESWVQAGERVL